MVAKWTIRFSKLATKSKDELHRRKNIETERLPSLKAASDILYDIG